MEFCRHFPIADPTKRTILHRGANDYSPICWAPDSKSIAVVLQADRKPLPDTGLWIYPVP